MASAAVPAQSSHAPGPPAGAAEPLEFDIVPRAGLPIVGVIVIALVVVIAINEEWPLMFMHVVGGASWTVIDLFLGFVLGPILGKLSIPARIELTTRLMPKMVLIMPTAVAVTLAAGWQLATKLGTNLTATTTTAGWWRASSSSAPWR